MRRRCCEDALKAGAVLQKDQHPKLLYGFFVPPALIVLSAELYNIMAFHLTDADAGSDPCEEMAAKIETMVVPLLMSAVVRA